MKCRFIFKKIGTNDENKVVDTFFKPTENEEFNNYSLKYNNGTSQF
jgi:hypothetical protein